MLDLIKFECMALTHDSKEQFLGFLFKIYVDRKHIYCLHFHFWNARFYTKG